jgi:uncharacterized protein with FMN-binding domain
METVHARRAVLLSVVGLGLVLGAGAPTSALALTKSLIGGGAQAAEQEVAAEGDAAGEAESVEPSELTDGTFDATVTFEGGSVPATVVVSGGAVVQVQLAGGDQASAAADVAATNETSSVAGVLQQVATATGAADANDAGEPAQDAVSGQAAAATSTYLDGSYVVPVQTSTGDSSLTIGIQGNCLSELSTADGGGAISLGTLYAALVECAVEAGGAYHDGTYTAEGKGIGGKFGVTVTIEGGVIASVAVGDNSETQGIGSKAIEQLPELIVEANGTEGVDGVSGASVTSKAIFSAVEECLAEAGGFSADASFAFSGDGVYTANIASPSGDVELTVGVSGGYISDIYFTPDASSILYSDFTAAVYSCADASARAWKQANTATYTDGIYTAEGKGIGGKFGVTVTIEGGVIASVAVGDNSETQGIGSKAIEQLPELIVEANGTDGVDGVSGASVTSSAIFSAVEDCLAQAS